VREQLDQRSTEAGERVGTVADDMRTVGRQLREQGDEVRLVALFDSFRPGYLKRLPLVPGPAFAAMHGMRIAAFHLGNLVRLSRRERYSYLAERVQRASFAARARAGRLLGRPSSLLCTQAALEVAYRSGSRRFLRWVGMAWPRAAWRCMSCPGTGRRGLRDQTSRSWPGN
jgi:hypothetical protein